MFLIYVRRATNRNIKGHPASGYFDVSQGRLVAIRYPNHTSFLAARGAVEHFHPSKLKHPSWRDEMQKSDSSITAVQYKDGGTGGVTMCPFCCLPSTYCILQS